jgi:hypothetical protein
MIECRSNSGSDAGGVPTAAHAKEVTTGLGVKIVIETACLAILKANARETGAAWHGRSHYFHDYAQTPFLIVQVRDVVANPQVKPLLLAQSAQPIEMLYHEINIRCGRTCNGSGSATPESRGFGFDLLIARATGAVST